VFLKKPRKTHQQRFGTEELASSPNLGDGPNLLTESRYGPFLINRYDTYIGQSMRTYGEYSVAELACFAQWLKPGSTAVEAGANIGAFSVGLSRLVGPTGHLFAYEPQRIVFQMLCANLALSQCTNVHAFQCGLGAHSGVLHVSPTNYHALGNFGGVALSAVEGEPVEVHPLDRWSLKSCDFIKIDVEGMEREVLEGARDTIRRLRPVLYVEDDRESAHAALVDLLVDMGYEMYWHLPALFSADNFKKVKENVLPATHSLNLVCIPKESTIPREPSRAINAYGNRWDGWKYIPGNY
jgi:FkbM family methyltransferase